MVAIFSCSIKLMMNYCFARIPIDFQQNVRQNRVQPDDVVFNVVCGTEFADDCILYTLTHSMCKRSFRHSPRQKCYIVKCQIVSIWRFDAVFFSTFNLTKFKLDNTVFFFFLFSFKMHVRLIIMRTFLICFHGFENATHVSISRDNSSPMR